MKKSLSLLLVLSLLFGLLQIGSLPIYAESSSTAPQENKTEEKIIAEPSTVHKFAEDAVVVVLKHDSSMEFESYAEKRFGNQSFKKIRDLTTHTGSAIQTKLAAAKEAIAIDLSGEGSSLKARETLSALQHIDIGSYNRILRLDLETTGREEVLNMIETLKEHEDVLYVGPDYVYEVASTTPNDPLYNTSGNWAYDRIDLPEAWDITTGYSSVRVGVLDSGISANHTDLSGHVNTTLSRNFTTGVSGGTTTGNTVDEHGHGTKVASVIGAKTNNSAGVSGVCWNVELVSLKILKLGTGRSSYAYEAINYATSINLPILNMSCGWTLDPIDPDVDPIPDPDYPDYTPFNPLYDYVLESVIASYPGLFICAAGNESTVGGLDLDERLVFPACHVLPNMISVGAFIIEDGLEQRHPSSNYGDHLVHLFAPGKLSKACDKSGGYSDFGETSCAAPFVTGVAALILSIKPQFDADDIKHCILHTVDVYPMYDNLCITSGTLNAYDALNYARTYQP